MPSAFSQPRPPRSRSDRSAQAQGARRATRPVSAKQRRAEATARRLGLGTRAAAGQLLHGRVKAEWIAAAGGRRFPRTLRWPLARGWFVRGFGSGEGGYHQAIDIGGRVGWNVRASAAGIVAYAGEELRGYGKVVLIVHPGGWVTMYAHNSKLLVMAGERVAAGAILAEVGSTGISRGPHVHYEMMWNGKNCDPAPLLRPAVRHRNGSVARVRKVTWRSGPPPRGIVCEGRRRHPHSRWVERPSGETEGGADIEVSDREEGVDDEDGPQ